VLKIAGIARNRRHRRHRRKREKQKMSRESTRKGANLLRFVFIRANSRQICDSGDDGDLLKVR
jgi:hypothetical protein